MSLIYPEKINPALQDFFQDQVSHPSQFNSIIHQQDEMYQFALLNQKTPEQAALRYYFNGKRILEAVRQVIGWHFGSFNSVSSFLDFASGYGRFTRFLTQKLSPQKIWISEINPAAVQFQVEQFGVQGIPSDSQPNSLEIRQQFDGILACSFFSHLPEKTFSLWMKQLYDLLTPDGILMFSVHDRSLLPSNAAIAAAEILFIPESESRSLAVNEYGTTYVGEEFVRNVINDISNKTATVHRIPQGICRYQDLYLVMKNAESDFSNLQFSHHPQGGLEDCHLTDEKTVEFKGWVSEINPRSRIENIVISSNNQFLHQFSPFPYRWSHHESSALQMPWSCQIPADQISPQDNLLITAVNSRGLEWVFEAATLDFLLQSKSRTINEN